MKQTKAQKRAAAQEAQTRAEIADWALMTEAECAAVTREAWDRALDPEAVAAEVAARGRAPLRAKNGKPARPIIVTDADGNPTKIVPSSQLLQALLEREGVDGATVEAKRPKHYRCIACGRPGAVPKAGAIPSWCRDCRKARTLAATRARRAENPERYREKSRNLYRRDREKSAAAARERRLRNPQSAQDSARKWAAKNQDAVIQNRKKWNLENAEHRREYQRERMKDPERREKKRQRDRDRYARTKKKPREP